MRSRMSVVEHRGQASRSQQPQAFGRWDLGRTGLVGRFLSVQPRVIALAAAIAVEVLLLLIALVPQSIWASHGFPNGPIPTRAAPLVAGAFYVLPAVTGLLSRRWQAAVVLATLPAWLDLGLFAIAAAPRIGPYYLAVEPHAVSTVGTLELFAVLGALGWLARPLVFGAVAQIRRVVRL